MSNNKGNRSKNLYGLAPRRSEYDDSILRNNQRTGNRFKRDMHYQERAQKVIMKDLGKESLLLQSRLESEKKSLSLSLFGSKFGEQTNNRGRKYSSTSPTGKISSSSSYKQTDSNFMNGRNQKQFPWDKDFSDRDSTVDRSSVFSSNNTPMQMSRTSMKFRTPSGSAYNANRAQTDDFLANILNEAMNDERLYTQGLDMSSQAPAETPRTGRTSRRTSKTPRNRMTDTPANSIVNALANVDPVES